LSYCSLSLFHIFKGYDDNGSGVAVLLEVASTLTLNSPCLRNNHSIIFVALDQEELGCLGSLEFIRSYLLNEFPAGPRGAFVLDTLLNYAPDEGAQTVPKDWAKLVPEADSAIKRRGKKVVKYYLSSWR